MIITNRTVMCAGTILDTFPTPSVAQQPPDTCQSRWFDAIQPKDPTCSSDRYNGVLAANKNQQSDPKHFGPGSIASDTRVTQH